MKRNRVRFYGQMGVFALFAMVGLVAICGEPMDDADFLRVFAIQMAVCAASWAAAAVVYHKWDLGRKMRLIEKQRKHKEMLEAYKRGRAEQYYKLMRTPYCAGRGIEEDML